MKIVPVTLLLFWFASLACHTNEPQVKAKQPIADTSKFYPLAVFFKKQIEHVDLRNYPIYKITVKDGKKDSSALSKEQFIALGKIFVDRSITEPKVKALYKETVFQDLSTKSYTLNYSPTDHTAEVQNIDILLDEETNRVKRIFIRVLYTRGDRTISEQCNWKTDKSFQINRFLQSRNGYKTTELNYINWNDTP